MGTTSTRGTAGVGDYELLDLIGAGASGTVWRARRRGPVPQVVAVKRVPGAARPGSGTGPGPDGLHRLRHEAIVLTELDHPHVVRVLEVVADGDGVAICMQYAPGGSLEALLVQRGRLTPGEVVAVAVPVAEALASTHRRGIVHGDVKPANILFTSDGEPLLGDFGIARMRTGQDDRQAGRQDERLDGTPDAPTAAPDAGSPVTGTAHYLAPELLHGAAPDARSDVYSLAVVCYEALTGRPPHDAATAEAVVEAADRAAHVPLTTRSEIPGPLTAVVEQAMARDPDRRFPTADLLAQGLRSALPYQEVRLPRPATPAITGHSGTGTAGAAARPAAGETGDNGRDADNADHADDGDEARTTRTFGPRPPVPEPPPPRRRRARLPVGLAVALMAAAGLYLVRGPLRSDGRCPEMPEPPSDPDGQMVAGDPEGDGCSTYGVYRQRILVNGQQAMVLTMDVDGQRRNIRLGEPGDQVVLGDWNCDGTDTPGLYRPVAGEVQYFATWPEEQNRPYPPQRTEMAPPGGDAALVTSPGRGDGTGDDQGGDAGDGAGTSEGTGRVCDRIRITGPAT